MDNLQSLGIVFFCAFFLFALTSDASMVFGRTNRIVLTVPGNQKRVNTSPLSPRIPIPKSADEKKAIDFTRPLKECWFFADNKIEAGKIASDNEEEKSNVNLINDKNGKNDNSANQYLFTPLSDGKVLAIDIFTAKKIWESDLGGRIASNIASDDKNIYLLSKNKITENVQSSEKNTNPFHLIIRSLNKKSGLTQWQTNLDFTDADEKEEKRNKSAEKMGKTGTEETIENCRTMIFGSDLIIYCDSGSVFSIDKNQGNLRWRRNYNFLFPSDSMTAGDHLIASSPEGFSIVSTNTGDVVESFKQLKRKTKITSVFYQFNKKRIIYGDDKGTISIIALRNETASDGWKVRGGAGIADISLTTRGFLASSLDNFLYMFSESGGELIWKKRLAGRIAFRPLIEGDYAVVTNAAEPIALVVDLQTGKVVNKITLEDGDFFTGAPLKMENRLLLITQRGIFAFADDGCHSSNEGTRK